MIETVAGGIGRADVERLLRPAAPDANVRVDRRLYYPYYWVQIRYAATTLFGRSALRVSCFIDARRGVGATTDSFELERVDADARDVLTLRIDEADARGAAERYAGYVVRNRRRALIAPSVDVVSCRIVHKPFWVVTCSPPVPLRALVDGITGGIHPLSAEDDGVDPLRFSAVNM